MPYLFINPADIIWDTTHMGLSSGIFIYPQDFIYLPTRFYLFTHKILLNKKKF